MSAKYPHNEIIGYENSPHPYELGLRRKELSNASYTILREDFFSASIAGASVIYSYMMPHVMQKIWNKIQRECKK